LLAVEDEKVCFRPDIAYTYHELALLGWKGMTRLENLARNLINKDSFLPGLQSFQRSLLRDLSEFFVFHGKAVKFFTYCAD
jgi:hypothetical protein